jgi:hypothetical protein
MARNCCVVVLLLCLCDGKENGELKNWKVPAIILVLLILAMTLRWSTVSTQTTTSSQTTAKAVIKHRQDNWNGAIYQQYYPAKGSYSETQVKTPSDIIWFDSQDLTIAWGVMAATSTIWLLYAVSKVKSKRNVNEENQGKAEA